MIRMMQKFLILFKGLVTVFFFNLSLSVNYCLSINITMFVNFILDLWFCC
jgi:hypothetical protein